MLDTSVKIRIARRLSQGICRLRAILGLSTHAKVTRRGILWDLDLKEGIDLAIYIFGGFELNTLKYYMRLVKNGDIVLDIGANIGAHTLPFAQLVGESGKVISFEPTSYAYLKQRNNIALNPLLSARIQPYQTLLVAHTGKPLADAIYSSWPLQEMDGLDEKHLGRLMSTTGASQDTLDQAIKKLGITHLNLIKLDVDGNELDVLLGSVQVIKHYQPQIIIELAPYVYDKRPHQFNELVALLIEHGYQLIDIANNRKLPCQPEQIRKLIPRNGSINALALPNKITV